MKHKRYNIPHIAARDELQHVYWIGGGSGSGKSTIARRIADQYNLHLYATDDMMADHQKRIPPEECPFLNKFISMDMDERWVNRSPKIMFDTFHWFKGEGFSLIIEYLLSLPKEPGVIVEGFRLLPLLVKPFLSSQEQAIWFLPTPNFRQIVFRSRDSTCSAWGFLEKTNNPVKAMNNLLERDLMFTNHIQEETRRLGLNAIKVDTTIAEDDLTKQVTELFKL